MGVYYKVKKNGERVWYFDLCIDGKRKRGIAGSGRSKREALNVLAELRSKYRKGDFNPFQEAQNPLFQDFAEKFLLWSKTNKRSHKRDQQLVNNLKRWFDGRKLSSIDSQDIEAYKIERKSEKRRCGNFEVDRFVSNATVNREVACLKKMFNLAIQWGDATRNPVNGIKFLQESNYEERYIDEKEFEKLYEAVCPTLKPVLLVAYNTGMRLEEYLSLKWSQVQLNDPPIKMVGNVLDYGYIRLHKTKSGKSRKVPINQTLWNLFVNQERDPNDYVLKASHGGRFSSVKDQFRNGLKKAGLEPARLHDLRGSWAT
ncbi:tyrosine-type recombinase/integrase, partial [Candidatus Saccharibacteria bacterium]|nr:tyrosine-type recombinase/integrase [Candidatus Saccharibacteria bacterium]NIW80337.1 tyrosine-type recombinase/integrase [Calditrichia bacterium]